MVAGIAIVRPGIGCWWEAAWWKARGWWKLRSATSLHRLATIDFLGTGPTLDPLQAIHCTQHCNRRGMVRW